jgi:NPCBM/NEW2 domain-containing protein
MNLLTITLLTLCLAPQVEVSTFQGEPRTGEWRGLSDGRVTLAVSGQETSVPLSEVLEVRFRGEAAKLDKPAAVVTLWDGTTLSCSRLQVTEQELKLTSPLLGKLTLPQSDVANIRFADRFTSVDEQWAKLTERELKSDLLVIRKEDVLDYLDGVVVDLTDKSVKFLLDGDEELIKREKIFGLLFGRRPTGLKPAPVRIELVNGDVVLAASVIGSAQGLTAKLPSKAEVPLPVEQLKAIDLSQGKLRYLSQLEPRDVKYTPYFDVTWEYRRDTNMDGGPLRLGNKVYARGLCLHSKTQLKYRLGGEYRRLQTVIGIDHLVASNGYGDCRLVISGDGKSLFEADVKAKDSPRPIDLDVEGVVMLEILVDFGGNLDISDHLDLADAKLVK